MRTSKYSQEFKDSTVQLALNSETSVLKIGADLDVNPKTIYNWIKIYKQKNNIYTDDRFKTPRSPIKNSESEELKRLRAENKLLRQERDILKKATAYFAKETL